MKLLTLFVTLLTLAVVLAGCGSSDGTVTTESASNAAAAQDPNAANPGRAGEAEVGGNKGTAGMPEGAGRAPVPEGGDVLNQGK